MSEKNVTPNKDNSTNSIQADETVAAPESVNSPELSVSDLNALQSIIDVASQRGAFRPNEMVTVGSVYTKLSNFLSAIAQKPMSQ